jgi:hypothetical protein
VIYVGFDINLIEFDLTNIKLKLSITDNEQDNLLIALCKDAYQYMYIFFDCDPKSTDKDKRAVPTQLTFILENVVVKRYRRLGAEGISIEKIDVLSTTYESGDDFAEYFDIMQKYKNKIDGKNGPRGFRFF